MNIGNKEFYGFQLRYLLVYMLTMLVKTGLGQPSVNSWSQIISYKRKILGGQHWTCFFPSIVGNKYYSDCYLAPNGHGHEENKKKQENRKKIG